MLYTVDANHCHWFNHLYTMYFCNSNKSTKWKPVSLDATPFATVAFTHLYLTFDLWPCKPPQQFSHTWWILEATYIEIPPLSTDTASARQVLTARWRRQWTDRQTDRQTTGKHNASGAYCWRHRQKDWQHLFRTTHKNLLRKPFWKLQYA